MLLPSCQALDILRRMSLEASNAGAWRAPGAPDHTDCSRVSSSVCEELSNDEPNEGSALTDRDEPTGLRLGGGNWCLGTPGTRIVDLKSNISHVCHRLSVCFRVYTHIHTHAYALRVCPRDCCHRACSLLVNGMQKEINGMTTNRNSSTLYHKSLYIGADHRPKLTTSTSRVMMMSHQHTSRRWEEGGGEERG